MSRLSRRGFLAATALAGVGTAGCLGRFDDDGPPPIGLDDRDVDRILAADPPTIEPALPVDLDPGHVEDGRERVDELLRWDSGDLAAEIPNEAVRTYIESETAAARDRLEQVAATDSTYASLDPLARARANAAEAEGAYAAALEGRVREDVYAEIAPEAARLAGVTDDLKRVGIDGPSALTVYEAIEDRLASAETRLERADEQSPLTSEVEVVGDASAWLERGRAAIEDAELIYQRQREAVDADRTYGQPFADAAENLLTDQEERLAALPDRDEEPAALFEQDVEGTPAERAAWELILGLYGQPGRIRDRLADGRSAGALMSAYQFEYRLRAADHLVERVDAGELDRPEDADAVAAEREHAIEAVQGPLEGTEHHYLVRRQVSVIHSLIPRGDDLLRRARNPDSEAPRAMGAYAVAIASARALPPATERVVDAIS